MTAMRHISRALVLGLTLGWAGLAAAGDISEITAKEFYAAAYYKQAMDDPRIQKIKREKSRLKKIARSIKIKPKMLTEALEKVGALNGEASELATAAIKSGFAGTRVEGRVLQVFLNTSEPKHVIAYVKFRGKSAGDAVKDAAMIANVVATKAPLVSTLSLSAIHPKAAESSKKSVWAAKISADRMANINPKRIDDYADRLYKRLFEIVESRPF